LPLKSYDLPCVQRSCPLSSLSLWSQPVFAYTTELKGNRGLQIHEKERERERKKEREREKENRHSVCTNSIPSPDNPLGIENLFSRVFVHIELNVIPPLFEDPVPGST
jgi:hypothetical protein